MTRDTLLYKLAKKLISSLELEYILPDACQLLVDELGYVDGCFVSCRSGRDGNLYLQGKAGDVDYRLVERGAHDCFNMLNKTCFSKIENEDVLHIPLIATGMGVGLLTIIGRELNDQDSFLKEIAELFSFAIQNGISYLNLIDERMIIEQVTREMRELYELTRSLTTAFHPDEVYEHLLRGVADIFICEVHTVLLVEDSQGTVYSNYMTQMDPRFSQKIHARIIRTWQILEQETLEIAEDNIMSVSKFEGNLRTQKLRSDSEIRSWLSAPLIHKDRSFGLLCVASTTENRFGPYHLEILYIVAGLAAKVIENARLSERLKQLATIDGLTNVYNHRTFQERLEEQFNLARRHKKAVSLIMLDIDHFKTFNDTYGHPIGDEVLKAVADTLKSALRDFDIVCRYGGEEFAVILPESTMKEAGIVAERLRLSIEQHTFTKGVLNLKITISLGVSEYPTGNQANREQLIVQADKMLYVAKLSGRNQAVCWSLDNEERYAWLKASTR